MGIDEPFGTEGSRAMYLQQRVTTRTMRSVRATTTAAPFTAGTAPLIIGSLVRAPSVFKPAEHRPLTKIDARGVGQPLFRNKIPMIKYKLRAIKILSIDIKNSKINLYEIGKHTRLGSSTSIINAVVVAALTIIYFTYTL